MCDANRCKGKEGYPNLAFEEVIYLFNRKILGVSSIQSGTRNDQSIVKLSKKWHWSMTSGSSGICTMPIDK